MIVLHRFAPSQKIALSLFVDHAQQRTRRTQAKRVACGRSVLYVRNTPSLFQAVLASSRELKPPVTHNFYITSELLNFNDEDHCLDHRRHHHRSSHRLPTGRIRASLCQIKHHPLRIHPDRLHQGVMGQVQGSGAEEEG